MNFKVINLLLIDDDEDDYVNIRDLLKEIKGTRFNVIWKSTYKEGLDTLKSQSFDACLLDHRLGENTGLEMLRETNRLGLTCPMILLTGFGDFELDIQAMQTGAAEYLVKNQLTAPLLERSIRYSVKHALDVEELKEREENFRTLFNSTFEGIIVHRRGLIHEVNSGTGTIFGYSPTEMSETPLKKYFRSDYHDFADTRFNAEKTGKFEAVGIKKDGSEITVELSNRTVSLKGLDVSLIAIRDLTERRQMEAQILQQDRMASLGLLASSLAHEIGTPMGVIRGRAELMIKRYPDHENLKADTNLIIDQIDRITKLVNSLLHLARGQRSDFAAAVNLRSVLDDILNLMSHELSRKGIDIKLNIEGDPSVKAESGPLGQVFLNLLVNAIHAIEFTIKSDPTKKHRVEVHVEELSKTVQISVRDTGCGIPEKNIPHLFKPFFTTKDIGAGTGLGLATSYKLVQSWGGAIKVDSKEGAGAKFTIELPKANPA